MKHLTAIVLLVFSVLLLPTMTFAQSLVVDPAIQQVVTEALPAKYTSYGTAVILAVMILGRFFKAMADGRGIKGWISAIINGTNGPRILIATLCLLSLSACSVDWKAASTAAANAAAPIVLDGLNKPAAKQPKSVNP